MLFDTSLGGLVLNDQFLQIVTRLQSSHVYGFGENNHDTLKHNVHERKSWGIFARDQGLSFSMQHKLHNKRRSVHAQNQTHKNSFCFTRLAQISLDSNEIYHEFVMSYG